MIEEVKIIFVWKKNRRMTIKEKVDILWCLHVVFVPLLVLLMIVLMIAKRI